MVQSYDVGSLPLVSETENFNELAMSYDSLNRLIYPNKYDIFRNFVLKGFKDKLLVGVDIPNYPQFRDMNEMFLGKMEGIKKTSRGYNIEGRISISSEKTKISEVSVIRENSSEISEAYGQQFKLKICVTGPYTLASLVQHKTPGIYSEIGGALSRVIESNVFSGKHGKVDLVVVDEPVFGFLNDPILDFGSRGREDLLSAWDNMFHSAKAKNMVTIIHLHNTSDNLFWDLKNLDVVESHVEDPLYKTPRTKELLDIHDKVLKAPIANAQFDYLISQKIGSEDPEKVAVEWQNIRKGRTDPKSYLEDIETMSSRLKKLIKFFGEEKIRYAGLECGLKSHPTYDCALECLRRQSIAVKKLENN